MPAGGWNKGEATAAVVGILNLQVILAQDGDQWVAQGIEIDYAAGGDNPDEVKAHFEVGLIHTIQEHLKLHRNLDRLFVPAKAETYLDLLKGGESYRYSQVSVHSYPAPEEVTKFLPFLNFAFIEPRGVPVGV